MVKFFEIIVSCVFENIISLFNLDFSKNNYQPATIKIYSQERY